MKRDDLTNLIEGALDMLAQETPQLPLERRIGERSVVARLAIHLNSLISNKAGLCVDVEYDKNPLGDRKWLDADKNLKSSAERVRRKIYEDNQIVVIPDIVIHKRVTNDQNCAVIEIKFDDSGKNEFEYARQKLRAFQQYPFKYKYGVLVSIPRNWDEFSDKYRIEFIGK